MPKKLKELPLKKKLILAVVAIAIGVAVYLLIKSNESIYVGIIETDEVDVAARVESQIEARLVEEGDVVKKGAPLYTFTCEDQIVGADKSTKDYNRAERLLKTGNLSPQDYDSYKAKFDYNNWNIDWCTARAPIDGTILTKFHEGGDHVKVGEKLMAMGDLANDVWAYVYVDQPMLAQVSLGQNVTGSLPEIKKFLPGKIIHIKDQAEFTPKNAQTRKERTRLVYGVKVKFDNSENILKPGMPIEVWFRPMN